MEVPLLPYMTAILDYATMEVRSAYKIRLIKNI